MLITLFGFFFSLFSLVNQFCLVYNMIIVSLFKKDGFAITEQPAQMIC